MCDAVYCTSRSLKGGVVVPDLSFHRYPKCPEVRSAWIKAVRRKDWEPKKYSRICSKHFEPSCYISGLKIKKLKWDAVPTIFEGYPKYYQPVVKKRKLNRQRAPCNDKPEMSQTLEEVEPPSPMASPTSRLYGPKEQVEPSRDRKISFNEYKRTQAETTLLATLERVQATSDRRLKQIKVLRESRRRALQKIAYLENVIKDLKNTCTLAKAHTHVRTYKVFVKDLNVLT